MNPVDMFQSTLAGYVQFFLERIPAAILTLVVGWLAIKVIAGLLSRVLKAAKVESTIVSLGVSVVTAAGWIIVIAAVLQALGLDQVALAVSGSIALIALAVGTGAAGTTGDIIAGVFLAGDPDFKVGYTVTAAGITGVIEQIDLRKTRIRAEDGKLNVVPNKAVESATWVVVARGESKA
jgi:small-conductance mechanosensitive channel